MKTKNANDTLAKIEALYDRRPTDANADRVAYARWLVDLHTEDAPATGSPEWVEMMENIDATAFGHDGSSPRR